MGFLQQTLDSDPIDISEVHAEASRVAKALVEAFSAEKIILFGSATDGSFKTGSDIDLLIIIENESMIGTARLQFAKKSILPRWPCDYLLVTKKRYEEMKDLGGPIFMADRFGKVLYDKRAVI